MRSKSKGIIQKFMEHIKFLEPEKFMEGILFCFAAPTIKGLKAACLINFRRNKNEDMRSLWKSKAGEWLDPLGVQWLLLNEHEASNNALVLIYRRELLARALGCCEACEILKAQGYPFNDLDACLTCLREKFQGDFPHEIGLFLDYPPRDVKGFMENQKCENQLRPGYYWKVYGDIKKARQTFRQYRRAEFDAARLILAGQ